MSNEPSFADLLKTLTDQYDLEELRTVCARLGVDFDSLRGEGKAGKARELILFLQRRGRVAELLPPLNLTPSPLPSPSRTPPAPGISYSLLTRTVPTAYCYQLTADQYPLVTVRIDNTGEGHANARLQVQAVIEGFSDPDIRTVVVPQGEIAQVALLPGMQQQEIARLGELRPARLYLRVTQHEPVERLVLEQTESISLLARDVALFAYHREDGSLVDLADYLVAWVTPHQLQVEVFLRKAADLHPNRSLDGYPEYSIGDSSRPMVREQARAIYNALQRHAGLTYINSPIASGEQQGFVTQRVRLPGQVLATGGSANCLDATVLFASLLELASLEPVLVLVPGHAFVGWRVQKGQARYEFVETLMIGTGEDFDAAREAATDRYDREFAESYGRVLFDPNGFLRLIDVASCRQRGIKALE